MKHITAAAAAFAVSFACACASPAAAQSNEAFMEAPPPIVPTCVAGFETVAAVMNVVKCRKTVPAAEMDAAVAEADGADCMPTPFWNYGPEVETSIQAEGGTATVDYYCRHING